MVVLSLFVDYIRWHYSRAVADLFLLYRNMLWGINQLVSFRVLFTTLLVPFRKLSEKNVSLFSDPAEFFASHLINLVMRVLGATIRLFIICFGVCALVVVSGIALCALMLWLILPFVMPQIFWSAFFL